MSAAKPTKPGSGWNLLVDYGPLVAFFLAYRFTPHGNALTLIDAVMKSTFVFMIAIIVAVLVAKWKLGRVTPMLWLSAILVVGFGGLTIWFHDPRFIQIKVTLIYGLFAIILFGGLFAGRPMLKYLLQAAFEGLDEQGWIKLSRNWAIFFAVLAVVNEGLRASVDFGTWLTVKTWGVTAASLLFGAANVPMLMRHGLSAETARDVEEPLPPQG
jgi:intracellular septation protein